jgi:multidrug efflux system membrane fusion protein
MRAQLFTAAVAATLLAGCVVREELAESEKPIPVKTIAVQETELSIPVRASGTLASKTEMKLSFKTSGIVEGMFAEEGQTVREGALLARLDLAEIESLTEQARAAFEKAQRDLDRITELYEDKVTTLEQFQDARTGFEIARSELKRATFNLQHSSIYAPHSGRVLRRFVEQGELVASGAPVFLFAQGTQDWIVRVGVTDVNVLRLRDGDPAELHFDAQRGASFSGRVTEIGETANPANGLFEVEIRLDPSGRRLVSGLIGYAEIFPAERQRYVRLPIEALAEGDGMTGFVFVLEQATGKVRKRQVSLAHIFDTYIAVSKGLASGERVVAEGTDYLVDGSPVRVVGSAEE